MTFTCIGDNDNKSSITIAVVVSFRSDIVNGKLVFAILSMKPEKTFNVLDNSTLDMSVPHALQLIIVKPFGFLQFVQTRTLLYNIRFSNSFDLVVVPPSFSRQVSKSGKRAEDVPIVDGTFTDFQ